MEVVVQRNERLVEESGGPFTMGTPREVRDETVYRTYYSTVLTYDAVHTVLTGGGRGKN